MLLKLLYLTILTLAWGLYKNFVFPFSYLGQNLNSYLVFKVFPVDFLLLGFPLIFLFRGRYIFKDAHGGRRNQYLPALFFLGLVMVSSLFSAQKETSFSQTARLILYLIFYFSLGLVSDLKGFFKKMVWLLTSVVLVEGALALGQFIKQSFIFGFVPLGEAQFSASTHGAPLVNLLGVWKLRSFGTFPHPNVLGGFLSLVLIWILDLVIKSQTKRQRIFLMGTFLLGALALFITFSQAAWGSFLIGLVLYGSFWTIKHGRKFLTGPTTILVMIGLSLTLLAIGRLSFDSVNVRRPELLAVSANLISQKPWFGVGLGNFVRFSLPEFPEPVHNLFLLMGAEVGLPALIVFIFFILTNLRRSFKDSLWEKKLLGLSLLQLTFLGLFDHYLWTSHPGQLLFWLVLGLLASSRIDKPIA